MAYTPTTWQNDPSTATPLSATNLNKMETGIDQAHDHIADATDAHDATAISYDPAGGINLVSTDDTVQEAIGKLDFTLGVVDSQALTTEQVQDIVNTLVVAGTNITKTYDDTAGTLTIAASGAGGGLTQEQVEDIVNTLVVAGTNITKTYDDTAGTLTIAAPSIGLLQEQIEDLVGTMIVAGTNITKTYDDTAGTLTIAASGGGVTREEVEDLLASSFVAGTGITITYSDVGNSFTITNSSPNQNLYSGSIAFGVDGAVTTRTGKHRYYNDSGRTRTIISVRATADTAPTGATLIVDVNKGGTTIFGTQASRPTIAISGNTNKSTGMTVTTWEDGTYLTVDVDQIGSTVAGSDLAIVVEWS